MTWGEMFAQALACKDKAEAEAWLERQVKELGRKNHRSRGHNRVIFLESLGYYAGYYNQDVVQKIYDLFGAEHPIFGRPDQYPATQEQSFKIGMAWGKAMLDKTGANKARTAKAQRKRLQ